MGTEHCQARVRRGGYFDRHDEICGKPAKGTKRMSIPHEEWVYTSGISEDRPACGIHLRARYVPGFPKAEVTRQDNERAYVENELDPIAEAIADTLTDYFRQSGFDVRAEMNRGDR